MGREKGFETRGRRWWLLLGAGTCLGAAALFAGLAVPAACAGSPGPDRVELRIREFDRFRYLRLEATGRVEYAVHGWYSVKKMRAGQAPGLAQEAFEQLRKLGFWGFEEHYRLPGGGPHVDPAQARLEVVQGRRKVVTYSLPGAPGRLQRVHRYLLKLAERFPDQARPGDYLRTYELPESERDLLRPEHVIHTLAPEELEAHPALAQSLKQPGRLVWSAPPGESPVRARSDLDPTGFFFRQDGRVYRVLVLRYPEQGDGS